jgi:hypothetical protein
MARESVTLVEIDMDTCANVFGTLPCTAVLSATVAKKCYGTNATCKAAANFVKATKTLRFCQARASLPKGGPVYFPALGDVTGISGTVNVAGSDARYGPIGRHATVSIPFQDFAYHDLETDPYRDQRLSGAAMFSGVGKAAGGTFFGRLKARWPYYVGRACRVITAEIVGGAFANVVSRSYVITGLTGPDDKGAVVVEAQDILSMADDTKAVAPKAGAGRLLAAMATTATTATLAPAGIGAQYATSGRIIIGSELLDFTRVLDVLTFTGRAVAGTVLATHNALDVVQPVLVFARTRLDDAVAILLRDYAAIPVAALPLTRWATEVSRWAPTLLLDANIVTPLGVASLVGDLQNLGLSIWSDLAAGTVEMKLNHPQDLETVTTVTDRNNLKAIRVDDRAADRLTEIYFYSGIIDPTKSATDTTNYRTMLTTYDPVAKSANAFGDTRVRRIFCRWLGAGNDGEVAILSRRLLNRFNRNPIQVRLTLDAKDAALDMVSLLSVQSRALPDDDGASLPMAMQVISRADTKPGQELELVAQAFGFQGRYGYTAENSTPVYSSATAAQKARNVFAVNEATMLFSDGTGPYKVM